MKEELKDEDILYLYITGETSPKGTWENMIPDIHGEHFRVTNDQWAYLMSTFKIGGVPYLFRNRCRRKYNLQANGIPRYRHDEKATDESFKEVIVKYITLIIGNASIVFSKTMEAFLYDYGSLSSSQAIQSLSVLLIYASQQSVSEPFPTFRRST